MARYDFRCVVHGVVEVRLPVGEAPAVRPCPSCGEDAVRLFSAPMVASGRRDIAGLIERTEKTRYEPEVVSSPPRRPASQRTPLAPPNPALHRLPRP